MKSIKNIRNILIFAAFSIFLSSCGNEWLDVYPSNRIETGKSIANIDDARSAIYGVYYQMQRSSYYGGRMMWFGDVRGDDMRHHGNSSTRSGIWYRYEHNEGNVPANLWSQPYTVIRLANNILAVIDNIHVSAAQEAERDYIKGEALMARALAHFDICRIFGFPYTKDNGASLGACIIRSPIEADVKIRRSTVAQCYNELIIPDLKAAIPLLTDNRTASRGRFNRWAAKLLLSRVYLYMDDNANALREAEECISGAQAAGYALYTNANYLTQWRTKFSTESLFEIVNSTSSNPGNDGIANWMGANNSNAYHEIGLTQSFYEILNADPDDVRMTVLTKGVNFPNLTFDAFILKYANGTTNLDPNVTIFRLSEAYLNAAEAAAKLANENDKAALYLNAIVNRANPAKNVTNATVITADMVIEERRKELFGEGHRSFDLLRNNMPIVRVGNDHNMLGDFARIIDRNNNISIMPIPIMEIEANNEIVRNP